MVHFLLQDDDFERRARQLEEQGKLSSGGPGAVPVNEPMIGPWSGNNNLGRFIPVSLDGTKRQTLLNLPEWGFPRQWTITLGMTNEDHTAASGFDYQVFADIEFGVGGCTQSVQCDWVNGTVLTVTANAVNVIARFVGVGSAEALKMKLGVTLSRYPRPGGLNPTITMLNSETIGGASNSGVILIPSFVKRVQLVSGEATAAGIAQFYSADTRFRLQSAGGATIVASKRGTDLQFAPGLDVVGSAREAVVFNDNVSALTCSMYGELAL